MDSFVQPSVTKMSLYEPKFLVHDSTDVSKLYTCFLYEPYAGCLLTRCEESPCVHSHLHKRVHVGP